MAKFKIIIIILNCYLLISGYHENDTMINLAECQSLKLQKNIKSTPITTNEIVIGFLAGYGNSKVILGAVPLAIETINNSTKLLPGKILKFKPIDIGRGSSTWRLKPIKKEQVVEIPIILRCENIPRGLIDFLRYRFYAIKQFFRAMTEMKDDKVVAFIGPDETCTTEALVAAAWNLPMISYKCSDTAVSDKNIYHSFARTLAPASKVSKSVVALLQAFNWKKFVIVTGVQPTWGLEVTQAIKENAEQTNLTVLDSREYADYIPTHISIMQKIVDETYKFTRIYVFIGEHIAMIDFVRCLQNRKLLETGEYIVISVDDEIYNPTKRSNIIERAYLDRYLTDYNMDLESFQSVLKLTMSHPTNRKFDEISENIKDYASGPPFRVPIHKKIPLTVPIYGAHLYDAILIYARAATEVLQQNGNLTDGRAIMDRIFNRSYHSILGFDVYIDSNGDAEGNYTVISLQDEVNEFNEVINRTMQPIGYFSYNSNSTIPTFKYLNLDKPINWINSQIPLDEPICGFQNDLCTKNHWRYLISGALVATFFLIACVFLIKHYRYEQKLAGILWKVDMKDVTLITTDSADSTVRTKSLIQTYRNSLLTEGDTSKRAYTSIGFYRGNTVAVKRLNKKSVDLTRNIRKELKQMREIHHENIITFIGASVDQGAVAILTTYCARGSLEDILANEDLSGYLDNMFISSLVSDIIKGLIYLHDSEIGSHGNLRSANCLVDSRWVCQIADFGLHEFKMGHEEQIDSKLLLKKKLWMAPELLNNDNAPAKGTQKGDVYSFGFILYEIFGRNGPWGDDVNCSIEEIIYKVCNPLDSKTYFRPNIDVLETPDYIKKCLIECWEENPDDRPEIKLVRVKLKEMQSGLKTNIFDNMLAIMEKYAYNLEGLVQARTNQLYEEKKKTEALLLRMLPKTVAESLKLGERVEAESFDCVTIFFSDLVGFTELCAKSTPFEVVEMLNDLYVRCDSIISNYDVYKVETIGDAYMVVSGLPIRNGNRHVSEIASLALHLLDCVSKLEIQHRPGELLQIRIGIHSGNCVAGVVGIKMPRYCLFGDTVNTASRMESTGKALKIHISDVTHNLLEKIGGFKCEERGLTFIKGKGEMKTYWLISEDHTRIQERFNSIEKMNNETNVAPDLICNNTESESITNELITTESSSFIKNNSRLLRQRARSSYINVTPINNSNGVTYQKIAWMNDIENITQNTINNQKWNGFCENCNKKQYENDTRNVNRFYDYGIYRISSAKCDVNNIRTCCICSNPVHLLLSNNTRNNNVFPFITTDYRSPRSAPHITFMQ